MEFVLASLSAIPEGEGRTFDVGRAKLAVFRGRRGQLFATQATCPHRGGMLADGLLGDGTLLCPLHAQKFDLATGRALNGECDLKTYPARESPSGEIIVEIDD